MAQGTYQWYNTNTKNMRKGIEKNEKREYIKQEGKAEILKNDAKKRYSRGASRVPRARFILFWYDQ